MRNPSSRNMWMTWITPRIPLVLGAHASPAEFLERRFDVGVSLAPPPDDRAHPLADLFRALKPAVRPVALARIEVPDFVQERSGEVIRRRARVVVAPPVYDLAVRSQ